MCIQTSDVRIKVNVPGAVARQKIEFRRCNRLRKDRCRTLFKMDAVKDFVPLLHGLENNHCQTPHWGYQIKGSLTVTYTNEETEITHSGNLFKWLPGHSVKVNQNAEFELFSPQHEHTIVFDHINSKLSA